MRLIAERLQSSKLAKQKASAGALVEGGGGRGGRGKRPRGGQAGGRPRSGGRA